MKTNSTLTNWLTDPLRPKLLLVLLLLSIGLYAQQPGKTIAGQVVDETDKPLPGVTVKVKGTSVATSTDENGKYAIKVNTVQDILTFSMLGMTVQEIPVGAKTALDVKLLPDSRALEDVVVVGYGTSSKKDVTGAVTSVTPDEFNGGVISTPSQLLQGKVAGLNITKSGNPNENGAIILRGPSSLRRGAQEPLYVIDGVPAASID
ncbi:MAG: SusC/RagA family TonB-linked outer membrane protein, partial [Sphingobacteriales bacterium]